MMSTKGNTEPLKKDLKTTFNHLIGMLHLLERFMAPLLPNDPEQTGKSSYLPLFYASFLRTHVLSKTFFTNRG